MSRFFTKYGLLFLILVSSSIEGCGQVLANANLNLNAGGYINDAIYDPYHNCYIVVGNFTTIGGKNRKNIAFLHKETLSVLGSSNVLPMDSIGGMDGEIRTVAITSNNLLPSSTISLYIGGNFSTITKNATNYTRNGIAKFTCTQNIIFPIPPPGNFSVSVWNADLDMTPLITGTGSEGVDDILITNDTVIFCGKFWAVNNSSTWDQRDGIAAYTTGGTLLTYPNFASAGIYNSNRFYTLEKMGPNLFLGGYVNTVVFSTYYGKLLKLNSSGNIDGSFSYDSGALVAVYDLEIFEDSLLIVAEDRNAGDLQPDQIIVCRQSNGSPKINHSLYPQMGGSIGGVGGGKSSLATHHDAVFTTSGSSGYSIFSYQSLPGTTPVTGVSWNANATNSLTASLYGKVHVAGNRLFVSAPNLTTLSGQSKIRLGAYCLEPYRAENFTTFDTTVCQDQTATYSIPAVDFADGYKWEYTGLGANIVGYGLLSPFIEIGETNANSVQIAYQSTFTPGQLKVTPYTLCNDFTKVYGNTISIDIYSNPLPHVNAGNDTTITCYNDSIGVQLYGYSDSSVINYTWVYPSALDDVDGQIDTAETTGFYVFKAVSPLGCPNYDTVLVSMDTIPPVATLPFPPYELTCSDTVKEFSGSSPTPNTVFEWYQGTTFFSDPISVNTVGSYYLRVTDTVNGCIKDAGIYVSSDYDVPNIQIAGYFPLNISQPIDTLTCFENMLNLTCYSDSANTTTDWINADTTLFYGDNIDITTGGNYFIFATNNSNGCTNSIGINIATDLNPPGVQAPLDNLLNCSVDSLSLDGDSLTVGSTLEWTGLSISPSADPVIIYDTGIYYLTATNPSNGCTSVDSLIISQDNSISVFAGNDTLVCDKEIVPLNVIYAGTISGITYNWNNGSIDPNTSYSAGLLPYAMVEVSGDGGCYGTDTVYINLPPVPVINFEGFKPCGDGPSGQIVATPVSGFEPFTYSIDGGTNFQIAPVFNGLYIGTYPIVVRDSLNCEYNFSATIDETSALPTPSFLFSTYNYETDTVVIVDISNPPTDSTFWLFPAELIVLDENALSPMILLPDTGSFEITMQAYYGTCLVEISKMIYASVYDSLAATQYNLNGIKSVELYPNPTTGNFTVDVEFYKLQRAALIVQDMLGNTYIFEEYGESLLITESVSLDGSVIDGTYILKIVSEFDSASITFILAR